MERVCIIGSDSRALALAWKLSREHHVKAVDLAPGNAGSKLLNPKIKNVDPAELDFERLAKHCKDNRIDLAVFSSGLPLMKGGADFLRAQKIPTFGLSEAQIKIEGSKIYGAKFNDSLNIPQPEFREFGRFTTFRDFVENSPFGYELAVKADGEAAGKGVILTKTKEEVLAAGKLLMVDKQFGEAGSKILVQRRVYGREVSVICLTDGETIRILPPVEDHKQPLDQDLGPNTGWMGAVGPVNYVTRGTFTQIYHQILQPAVKGLFKETGERAQGALFANVILTDEGPLVLEWNGRLGNPETSVQMRLANFDLYPVLRSCTSRTLASQNIDFRKGVAACVVLASEGYPGKGVNGKIIYGLERNFGEDIVNFTGLVTEDKDGFKTGGGREVQITAYRSLINYYRSLTAHQDALNYVLRRIYSVIGEKGIHFEGMHYRKDIGKRV